MKPIDVYRRDAEALDLERRRLRARLSYEEKLAILHKLRRSAHAISGHSDEACAKPPPPDTVHRA